MKKIVLVQYPTPQEKLAHLVRLTAEKLSETKDKKKQRVLVNQLQRYRQLWERSNDEHPTITR